MRLFSSRNHLLLRGVVHNTKYYCTLIFDATIDMVRSYRNVCPRFIKLVLYNQPYVTLYVKHNKKQTRDTQNRVNCTKTSVKKLISANKEKNKIMFDEWIASGFGITVDSILKSLLF